MTKKTIVKIKLINGYEYIFNEEETPISVSGAQVVVYDKANKTMIYIPWSAILILTIETREGE